MSRTLKRKADEFLTEVRKSPCKTTELKLLLLFLAEYAPLAQKSEEAAYRTGLPHFVESANSAYIGVRQIISRIEEIYNDKEV